MNRLRNLAAVRRSEDALRRALQRRSRVAVLAYHSVSSSAFDPWKLSVSPANFARHITALQRTGRILPVDDIGSIGLVGRLRGSMPRYGITFDDGYADNLHAALPILERFEAPATVFVISGSIGESSFWWDDLAGLVFGTNTTNLKLLRAAAEAGVVDATLLDNIEPLDRNGVHELLYRALGSLATGEIKPRLLTIARLADTAVPSSTVRPMTMAELRRLAAHPLISVGAHTVTHPRLTELGPTRALEELRGGKADLDRWLDLQIRHLAYPYGDTNASVADLARSIGFEQAFTTDPRYHSLRPDRLMLPRLHPHDFDGREFEQWLAAS